MSDPRRRWSWQMLKGARTIRVAGRKASWPQMLGNALRTRFEHLSLYIKGRQRLHHGPRTRIPDFAARRDWHFFNIIAHGLILGPATRQHDSPPPFQCHDLLDAAARVGQLEVRLGYTFKDKMKAMEALKLSNPDVPIVHDGRTYLCAKHQRIALLGDRVLELAVAQRWHGTGYSAATYSAMASTTTSGWALALLGHELGLERLLLPYKGATTWSLQSLRPDTNPISETVEAIVGAVYLDSDYSLPHVMRVLDHIGVTKHKYLQAQRDTKQSPAKQTQAEPEILVGERLRRSPIGASYFEAQKHISKSFVVENSHLAGDRSTPAVDTSIPSNVEGVDDEASAVGAEFTSAGTKADLEAIMQTVVVHEEAEKEKKFEYPPWSRVKVANGLDWTEIVSLSQEKAAGRLRDMARSKVKAIEDSEDPVKAFIRWLMKCSKQDRGFAKEIAEEHRLALQALGVQVTHVHMTKWIRYHVVRRVWAEGLKIVAELEKRHKPHLVTLQEPSPAVVTKQYKPSESGRSRRARQSQISTSRKQRQASMWQPSQKELTDTIGRRLISRAKIIQTRRLNRLKSLSARRQKQTLTDRRTRPRVQTPSLKHDLEQFGQRKMSASQIAKVEWQSYRDIQVAKRDDAPDRQIIVSAPDALQFSSRRGEKETNYDWLNLEVASHEDTIERLRRMVSRVKQEIKWTTRDQAQKSKLSKKKARKASLMMAEQLSIEAESVTDQTVLDSKREEYALRIKAQQRSKPKGGKMAAENSDMVDTVEEMPMQSTPSSKFGKAARPRNNDNTHRTSGLNFSDSEIDLLMRESLSNEVDTKDSNGDVQLRFVNNSVVRIAGVEGRKVIRRQPARRKTS